MNIIMYDIVKNGLTTTERMDLWSIRVRNKINKDNLMRLKGDFL